MGESVQSDRGISLIEVLIVAATLSVMAAFVVPQVRVAQEGYTVHTSAFNVAQKLQEARTDALKRNRQTWLLIDGFNRSAQIQTTGPTGIVNIGFPEQLPPGLVFAGLAGTTMAVVFDPVGRPTAPPITFQLRSVSGITRTVTVVSTGRVTVN